MKRKKPGPKTPWQNRVRYNRERCLKRLKPSQIQNLTEADFFSGSCNAPLNGFLTIKFSERGHPLNEFQAGTKRLAQWHRRWGGELRMIYVWEAVDSYHLHALVHVRRGAWQLLVQTIATAFAGHDTRLKQRYAGPSMLAYVFKGTDLVTHWKLGSAKIKSRRQGIITWKRCGTTANIGDAARKKQKNNCAETCTPRLHGGGRSRASTHGSNRGAGITPTYVVSKTPSYGLEATCGAAHTAQAQSTTPDWME